MTAYLNLPQPDICASPAVRSHTTDRGTTIAVVDLGDATPLSVHIEDAAHARALAAAFTQAASILAPPALACMNCGEPDAPGQLMAVHITERGAERTDYYCADVRACYRRAHRPPCVECGGAYPGHDIHCPLRPAVTA